MDIVVLVIVVVSVVALAAAGVLVARRPRHCWGLGLSTLRSAQELRRAGRDDPQGLVGRLFGSIGTGLYWVVNYLRYRLTPKHRLVSHDASRAEGIHALRTNGSGSACLAITGDWGDGSDNARRVAAAIDAVDADYTSHQGDVYSVEAANEMDRNFIGSGDGSVRWPSDRFGTLAVPGNHEYHSGAHAFCSHALARHLGLNEPDGGERRPQAATYFCRRNDHWQIIGLDTGYHSVKGLGVELVVKPINWIPGLDGTAWAWRLKTRLPADRRILWFCGHGHRLEIHGEDTPATAPRPTVLSRTVGNGAETDTVEVTDKIRAKIVSNGLQFADNRNATGGRPEGSGTGYPGFATLRFTGDELAVDYYAVGPADDGTDDGVEVVFQEEFRAVDGNVADGSQVITDPSRPGYVGSLVPGW